MRLTGIRRVLLRATAATVAAPAVALAAGPPQPGLPQFDFGNPLMKAQVVWMLIIFGLLYVIVSRLIVPRVGSILDNRRMRIEGDLEAAQRMKQDADTAMDTHRAETARARSEGQAAVAAAVLAAEVGTQARADTLNARLAAQIAEAETRIDRARAAAMGTLREVAADTTDAVVTKLLGRADPRAVAAAVERALAARGRA